MNFLINGNIYQLTSEEFEAIFTKVEIKFYLKLLEESDKINV